MTNDERIDLLSSAGRILLENGGETYRAEETVRRMAAAMGMEEPQAFAIPSGLFLSYTDEEGEKQTGIVRIHRTGTRLDRVDEVNRVSRALAHHELGEGELALQLHRAEHLGEGEPWWALPLMALISAAGFALMFGGGPVDMLVGGLCAALTQIFPLMLPREHRGGLSNVIVGGIECALLPLLFTSLTGIGNGEAMIAAALMPLVPGLSMTTGVQDLIRGDMVSGVVNAAGALLTAALLAGGSMLGTTLFQLTGLKETAPAALSLPSFWREAVLFLAGLLGAGGFAGLLAAPRKTLLQSALLGGGVYLLYVLLSLRSEAVGMLACGVVSSLGAQWMARQFHHVSTLYEAAAILPLVPGLGLYRAMRSIGEGAYREGAAMAAEAMGLILLISVGLAVGSALNTFLYSAGQRH